ncbi:hypothetical protein CLF_108385 [Clonorchis sinensis]|uniref:Uncharacterized protein n=1 Tax=Clonorchis sinensis TaxID=79923 RepID=G7YHZ4_CLOSI|nr:hypothetical protein CLF_108385 [Clonorchis sinensis]
MMYVNFVAYSPHLCPAAQQFISVNAISMVFGTRRNLFLVQKVTMIIITMYNSTRQEHWCFTADSQTCQCRGNETPCFHPIYLTEGSGYQKIPNIYPERLHTRRSSAEFRYNDSMVRRDRMIVSVALLAHLLLTDHSSGRRSMYTKRLSGENAAVWRMLLELTVMCHILDQFYQVCLDWPKLVLAYQSAEVSPHTCMSLHRGIGARTESNICQIPRNFSWILTFYVDVSNGSLRQSVSELRILFKSNVDERRVRDAQNLGQVYPYLYGLACTNVTVDLFDELGNWLATFFTPCEDISVSELRILFKSNVDERRVRDAQNLGQVYSYLFELACTNGKLEVLQPWCFLRIAYQLGTNRMLQLKDNHFCCPQPQTNQVVRSCQLGDHVRTNTIIVVNTMTLINHPWLSSCQIVKYHINRFSDQTAIVLVDSETSTAADEELASIQDDDQKLLTIANRLNILTYCVEVQEVGNVALSRENFDSLKHTLAKQLQSQIAVFHSSGSSLLKLAKPHRFTTLAVFVDKMTSDIQKSRNYCLLDLKCAAHETTRIVNVIPRRVLDFEGRLAVSAFTHFHTKFHPAETGFPEQWKMGLQGVIDSLGVNKGLGINFQLPVYGDFKMELGMYVPNFEQHVGILDPRSMECKMLDSVFELLGPISYDCYPSDYVVTSEGADLYATALVQVSISSISVHLGGNEYSDLAFLELLCRKCQWASFSVFTFSGVASYHPHHVMRYNQRIWLKSLSARQRRLAGNSNSDLEGQETVLVRPVTIDQPGMRDYECRIYTPHAWVTEAHEPSHYVGREEQATFKNQLIMRHSGPSLRDSLSKRFASSKQCAPVTNIFLERYGNVCRLFELFSLFVIPGFAHPQLQQRLEIPSYSIKCRMLGQVPVGNRVALEAHMQIPKHSGYWEKAETYWVPLRLSAKLNTRGYQVMNVRWRRRPKYSDQKE